MTRWMWLGLAFALLLAVAASPFASSWLDGLERVAREHGFLARGEGPAVWPSPLAGYALPGVGGGRLATAAAGGVGTLLVFGVTLAVAAALRRRRK